jgi:hypothetical protein
LEPVQQQRWQKALAAADHLRDKFGESAIGVARGMKGGFRERVHENPAALPGKAGTKNSAEANIKPANKPNRSQSGHDD